MSIAMEGPKFEDTKSSVVIRQACKVKNSVEAVRKVIKDMQLAIVRTGTDRSLVVSVT